MARKKMEVEENIQDSIKIKENTKETEKNVKVEEVKEVKTEEKQESEMEFLKAQNQDLQNKILEMQQMMLQMQMNNQITMQQSVRTNSKTTVAVKSYSFNQIGLCTKDGYNSLASFTNYGEIKKIPTKSFDDAILDERNRRFFEQGVLGFVDEADYETYDFTTIPQVLSIENIEALLQKDDETIFSTLDSLTANRRNNITTSVIFANIVNSIDNISVKGNLVAKLNRYFGVDIYKMVNNYFLYNYHKQGKVTRKEK